MWTDHAQETSRFNSAQHEHPAQSSLGIFPILPRSQAILITVTNTEDPTHALKFKLAISAQNQNCLFHHQRRSRTKFVRDRTRSPSPLHTSHIRTQKSHLHLPCFLLCSCLMACKINLCDRTLHLHHVDVRTIVPAFLRTVERIPANWISSHHDELEIDL